jgi:2-dehydro-3-deoxyphosphogluconate aldolase/(4S)-4-hydroxy-2-oxoglutarate aldolase
VIRKLVKDLPEMPIGAGTVLDQQTASRCIDQGAQYIISSLADLKIIKLGVKKR